MVSDEAGCRKVGMFLPIWAANIMGGMMALYLTFLCALLSCAAAGMMISYKQKRRSSPLILKIKRSVVILVKIIMGLKGSGKTKKLVDLVREAVSTANGDVVVFEKDKKLTYDIPYQARLVDAGSYPIGRYEFLKGMICGVHAGNYDITHFFIDNFLKMVDDKSPAALGDFIDWLRAFSEKEGIEFIISVSGDAEGADERVKACFI